MDSRKISSWLIEAAANRRSPIHVLETLHQGLLLPLLLELFRLFIVCCSFLSLDIFRHLAESWPSLEAWVSQLRFLLLFSKLFRHDSLWRPQLLHRLDCSRELSVRSEPCHGFGYSRLIFAIDGCILFADLLIFAVAILGAESVKWTKQASVDWVGWDWEFYSWLCVASLYLWMLALFLCIRPLML